MELGLGICAGVLAVAAAVRSTWSPCGLSMLSTVTPVAERARGHRYWVTACWFLAGAVLGGATLGLVAAALAVVAPVSAVLGAVVVAIALGRETLDTLVEVADDRAERGGSDNRTQHFCSP